MEICQLTCHDFIWIVKLLAMNRTKVRHRPFAPNAVSIRFDGMRWVRRRSLSIYSIQLDFCFHSQSGSWNGSRSKLDRAPIEDIDTIIHFCSSTHWAERKDGLTSLTQYLSEGKYLTPDQLQNILDLFRKMFMDTHTKVYALFLDTVNELIILHSNDLYDWLFILLTRLFNKLGTELLGSMHGKIWKTLSLVHEYFPSELQLKAVFR